MDNVYEITVQAMDSTGKTGMKMVEVMVTDVDEPGMVTLSALQPQAGTALTATITDPDGVTAAQYDRFDRPTASSGSGPSP